MQILNNSEKSRGVVVFAFNTNVDYVAIADQTSRLIQHYLQLPITLITDATAVPEFAYDYIVRIDPATGNHRSDLNDQTVEWRNFGRYLAYEFSPYTETILLDTDYLVLDNSLLKLFESKFDYQLQHHNYTPDGASYEQMGETSLPFVWATVVLFQKTDQSRLFFNLVGRIQRNYRYYRALYNIREGNYRNDYAFAVANNILNGYALNQHQSIPWPMFTIDQKITHITTTDKQIRVCHDGKAIVVPYQNIHVLDKEYLISKDFKQVVETIIGPA